MSAELEETKHEIALLKRRLVKAFRRIRNLEDFISDDDYEPDSSEEESSESSDDEHAAHEDVGNGGGTISGMGGSVAADD